MVSWCSSKQQVVSRSSAESEYRGLSNATPELIWIQFILFEIGVGNLTTPLLLCDNLSATYMAANPILHNQAKHLEIDLHFIQEKVAHKQLFVRFVPSEDQLADVLTKALPSPHFSTSMSSNEVMMY